MQLTKHLQPWIIQESVDSVADLPTGSIRDGFGKALAELGASNEAIVAVSADLTESTRLNHFEKAHKIKGMLERGFNGAGTHENPSLKGEIWVNNWLYVNDQKRLEDSVSIHREHSFNADAPMVLAMILINYKAAKLTWDLT